jgi:hypothetical protein
MTATLLNQVLDVVWPKLPAAAPAPKVEVPETAIAEEELPAPEVISVADAASPAAVPSVAETEVKEAAEPVVSIQAPAPAFVPPTRPLIELLRVKPNPIRGVRHTFGGLSERGWLASNPLKRSRR